MPAVLTEARVPRTVIELVVTVVAVTVCPESALTSHTCTMYAAAWGKGLQASGRVVPVTIALLAGKESATAGPVEGARYGAGTPPFTPCAWMEMRTPTAELQSEAAYSIGNGPT